MLKKILIISIFIIGLCGFANMSSELEDFARNSIFSNDFVNKLETAEFKSIVDNHKKDNNYLENYYAAQTGFKYFKNNNLTGIFTKMDIMYMYTLQERSNLRVVYYYDIWGNLKSLEFLYGNYPSYPYFSRKYNIRGKFMNAEYHFDKNNTLRFDKSGKLKP